MLKGCGMGFFNFVYIFYLARYLLCSQCKGGVFVSNVNLYVIVTCCKPKRNTSCQRGGGKHKTGAKVGISLPLSASRFSSLDSLFPQPPLSHLLPTFILSWCGLSGTPAPTILSSSAEKSKKIAMKFVV